MSRTFISDMLSVRGMGVAVRVRQSTERLDLLQPLLVLDAEALLLVHHEEAEVPELHVLLDQAVGADGDVDLAAPRWRRWPLFSSFAERKRDSMAILHGKPRRSGP